MATIKSRMLSKEDEAATEEVEVRREDQEKINKFSRLHQREFALEESLKQKQKDKEDLEEIVTELEELELMDEDARIPYKIGDSFFTLTLPEVQELVEGSKTRIEIDVEKVEGMLNGLREEMSELKVALYGRFGRSINLET
ncbi:Prefoldin, subunit 4 [Tothia fuscella]|uniref:Prefoldin subunit 4 n=1 Tax=Tothia fuscella TaxID=1048955 RepID=A0A9P4TYR5_9PEZI|nr:Prefoldin, subunit 4 [Tothia fuscella]